MKSPFPGMDPYLEAHWGDVHASLMVYARNQLNAQLPDDLQVRVVETPGVLEGAEPASNAGVAIAEPYLVSVADEIRPQRHLEIIDTTDHGRLVTAIEVLSPANKTNANGQLAYIRKQREYLDAGANLVEIDLIRSGGYVLSAPEDRLPAECHTPYLACVRRATRLDLAEVYAIPLRQPLPNIRVPLRPSDADVMLQLQSLLDDCYRDGRYHRINYRADPTPRFGETDMQWLDQLLREKGLRS